MITALSPSSKSKQLIYEDKLKDEIKQWTNLMRDTNKNLESYVVFIFIVISRMNRFEFSCAAHQMLSYW